MIGNPEASVETEDQIEFKFVSEQVEQIISRLPEKQKTIFRKSRQEGMSTKEIADELGLSPGLLTIISPNH